MTQFDQAFAQLEGRADAAAVPAWTRDLRRRSFEAFNRMGLPTRRHEEWKYTSLRSIADRSFRLAAAPGEVDKALFQGVLAEGDIALVFVDGVLSTGLSQLARLPAGVKVQSLAEAPAAAAEAATVAAVETPFEHLSRAFYREGLSLEVAAGALIEAPVHLLHVATVATADRVALPRHRITVGAGASLNVIESYVGPATQAYLSLPVTDITLAAKAQMTYTRIQREGRAATNLGAVRAVVAADAELRTFNFGSGARLSRLDLDIALVGERAAASMDGLYLVRGEQHLDNHTAVEHLAPATRSSQLYKGVLNDSARAVFNGKVLVRHAAPQTDAQQLNKNLLLSSDAEIDTKPELQIDVDDVKCSHGAAIGRLDADEIFYLQTRGLDRARAERMLMRAFAEEVIYRFNVPALERRLLALAAEALA